jgi:hypothetical protein
LSLEHQYNPLQKFIHKFNWRLITIHLFAAICLVWAADQLVLIPNVELIKGIAKLEMSEALKQKDFRQNFLAFIQTEGIFRLTGLLISFIISLLLTIKRKVFWLNSLIPFLIVILLFRSKFFDNTLVHSIFLFPGRLANPLGLIYNFMINSVIYLILGLLFFFNKRANKYAYTAKSESV